MSESRSDRWNCHGCGSVYGPEKFDDPELQARACCSVRGYGSDDDYSLYTGGDNE